MQDPKSGKTPPGGRRLTTTDWMLAASCLLSVCLALSAWQWRWVTWQVDDTHTHTQSSTYTSVRELQTRANTRRKYGRFSFRFRQRAPDWDWQLWRQAVVGGGGGVDESLDICLNKSARHLHSIHPSHTSHTPSYTNNKSSDKGKKVYLVQNDDWSVFACMWQRGQFKQLLEIHSSSILISNLLFDILFF